MKDTEITHLKSNAVRQYIDAVKVFEALEEAVREGEQVRGGMYWHKGPKTRPEATYLVRTTPAGGETSLGARSAQTEQIFERFTRRRQESDERVAGLRAALVEQERMNKALFVGRVEPIIVDLLNRLASSHLGEHFRVVGTHALYAYEAAASIRFEAEALATRDIDLLWDIRKRVQFATQLARIDSSMLGVLKKVDKTFRVRDLQKYTAVNSDGFEVDILRRQQIGDDPHPVRLSDAEDDFFAVQALNAHRLLDAPPFSAVIVATNGRMARMTTLHPLAFARFKEWMSKLKERELPKRRRDELQAVLVKRVVQEFLPHLAADTSA